MHESSAHDGAVLALDLCEAGTDPHALPIEDAATCKGGEHLRWILSVGADRVVKAWSLDLRRLGQLTSVSLGLLALERCFRECLAC